MLPTPSFDAETSGRVCAVVISFFPDAGFPERVEMIAAQVSRVIVVDNGTTGKATVNLERALDVRKNVTCIRNSENLGIAIALNQGIRQALSGDEGCSWVVTFDQDSLPPRDMVKKMLTIWESHPHPEKVMVAGSRTTFVGSTSRPDPAAGRSWREVTYVITSGSLVPRRAFELAGYYNEGLFIDYVDIEYCLRLRTLGYQVIEILDTEILHQMGRLEERLILGEKVHPTHHPPLRRYYQFRNAILLHRQYRESQRSWCRKDRIILMKILILIFLYDDGYLRSLAQILRGIGHGLAGRSGKDGEALYVHNSIKTS